MSRAKCCSPRWEQSKVQAPHLSSNTFHSHNLKMIREPDRGFDDPCYLSCDKDAPSFRNQKLPDPKTEIDITEERKRAPPSLACTENQCVEQCTVFQPLPAMIQIEYARARKRLSILSRRSVESRSFVKRHCTMFRAGVQLHIPTCGQSVPGNADEICFVASCLDCSIGIFK